MPIGDIKLDFTQDDPLEEWANRGETTWRTGSPPTDKEPNPKPIAGSDENALYALVGVGAHKGLWLNEWTGRIMIKPQDGTDQQFDDRWDITRYKIAIEDHYGNAKRYIPTREAIRTAVDFMAYIQRQNPRVKEIRELHDDATVPPNLYKGLAIALHQDPENDLLVEICKLLVRGVVVRAIHPGADFPYCPIIYSPHQGAGKGHTLKILSGGYHSELLEGVLGHRDAQRIMMERFRGKSVVEVGEFNGVSGRSLDVLKSIITDGSFAGVRGSYDRDAKDWPMTAILVGTTNSDSMLTDSENRRHPVLTIPQSKLINTRWIKNNVGYLWAQAYQDYLDARDAALVAADYTVNTGGEVADFMGEDAGIILNDNGSWRVQLPERLWGAAREQSAQFRQSSPVEEWLSEELIKYPNGRLLGLPLFEMVRAKFGRMDSREFSSAMKACGWAKRRMVINNSPKVNIWERADGMATGDPVPPVVSFI